MSKNNQNGGKPVKCHIRLVNNEGKATEPGHMCTLPASILKFLTKNNDLNGIQTQTEDLLSISHEKTLDNDSTMENKDKNRRHSRVVEEKQEQTQLKSEMNSNISNAVRVVVPSYLRNRIKTVEIKPVNDDNNEGKKDSKVLYTVKNKLKPNQLVSGTLKSDHFRVATMEDELTQEISKAAGTNVVKRILLNHVQELFKSVKSEKLITFLNSIRIKPLEIQILLLYAIVKCALLVFLKSSCSKETSRTHLQMISSDIERIKHISVLILLACDATELQIQDIIKSGEEIKSIILEDFSLKTGNYLSFVETGVIVWRNKFSNLAAPDLFKLSSRKLRRLLKSRDKTQFRKIKTIKKPKSGGIIQVKEKIDPNKLTNIQIKSILEKVYLNPTPSSSKQTKQIIHKKGNFINFPPGKQTELKTEKVQMHFSNIVPIKVSPINVISTASYRDITDQSKEQTEYENRSSGNIVRTVTGKTNIFRTQAGIYTFSHSRHNTLHSNGSSQMYSPPIISGFFPTPQIRASPSVGAPTPQIRSSPSVGAAPSAISTERQPNMFPTYIAPKPSYDQNIPALETGTTFHTLDLRVKKRQIEAVSTSNENNVIEKEPQYPPRTLFIRPRDNNEQPDAESENANIILKLKQDSMTVKFDFKKKRTRGNGTCKKHDDEDDIIDVESIDESNVATASEVNEWHITRTGAIDMRKEKPKPKTIFKKIKLPMFLKPKREAIISISEESVS